MTYPKWATPERRAYLVELFHRGNGFCVYGHKPCPNPDHHYETYIEMIIGYWKEDDRSERVELLRLEQKILHWMPDQRGWGRRFDPVARERFFENQPPYYLEGIGISGLTFKPIAEVRVPSTYIRLFVDVPKSKLSKNQRRKAKRYQRMNVEQCCSEAVKDFWANL